MTSSSSVVCVFVSHFQPDIHPFSNVSGTVERKEQSQMDAGSWQGMVEGRTDGLEPCLEVLQEMRVEMEVTMAGGPPFPCLFVAR